MILLHDKTLDRTTDCSGPAEEATFAELQQCDAGSWFSPAFAAERIPTFEEVLAYLAEQPGVKIIAEIKGATITTSQARAYVAAIHAANVADRTIMSSYSAPLIAKVRSQDPKVTIASMLITYKEPPPPIATIKKSGTTYLMPMWQTLNLRRAQAIQDSGVQIWACPATTINDYEGAFALGVDAIVANDVTDLRGRLADQ
jgi:glycerophosphoryl diester phosphodiesterase